MQMRGYPLYELSEDEFEQLVSTLCKEILGIGTVSFTKGKDGGKDGRFKGVAKYYPSDKSPWNGKFIIQAKHTNKPNGSFSDSDFKAVILKEIKRIKKIKNQEGLDNYLIFTNRKHTAIVGDNLIKKIKDEVNIDNIEIIGNEDLIIFLRRNQDIVDLFDLDNLKNPLRIFPEDIKDIIIAFSDNKDDIELEEIKDPFKHVDIELKNKINNLNEDYFNFIKDKSQVYFSQISKFLGDPKNKEFLEQYENISNELQAKIITNRDKFTEFNKIFEYYYDFILAKCPELKKKKRLIRIFLHFMYWSCDIGKKND